MNRRHCSYRVLFRLFHVLLLVVASHGFVVVTRRSQTTSRLASSTEQQRQDATTTNSPHSLQDMIPICEYHQVTIPTSKTGPPRQAISVEDVTPTVQKLLKQSEMKQGVIHIISRHTTTALCINERESRLAQDMATYFLQLAPPDERSTTGGVEGVSYKHNDIELRPDSPEEAQRCKENGWNIDNSQELQKWRDQEPINAHSHLLSMLVGSSECIPVVDAKMVLGQWQSILLVDLDGPRDRTVGIQLMGYK
uniref:Secondary thiamine-phosphate synthase enzyme n=1 Tax=Grammatophora oceanica TaxID=210454 RepID=A0A7S1Y7Z6_9STRA|mmetsp:Transcript_29469/g.43476  ORF Transcript_29469/g.43476 Transcript_29469/m.43476 type:complete len:251 (+) Transcript_29469:58-810(+)